MGYYTTYGESIVCIAVPCLKYGTVPSPTLAASPIYYYFSSSFFGDI